MDCVHAVPVAIPTTKAQGCLPRLHNLPLQIIPHFPWCRSRERKGCTPTAPVTMPTVSVAVPGCYDAGGRPTAPSPNCGSYCCSICCPASPSSIISTTPIVTPTASVPTALVAVLTTYNPTRSSWNPCCMAIWPRCGPYNTSGGS